MNVELLRKVAERIVERPHLFDMAHWFYNEGRGGREQCGTTACIAGEVCLMTGRARIYDGRIKAGKNCSEPEYVEYYEDWSREGAAALEITEEQRHKLFHVENWPIEFKLRYHRSDAAGRACAAADRIRHFIKTWGRE